VRMYLSECGGYVCRVIEGCSCDYEAWTVDGAIHWQHDNRVKTWKDAKKRRHPLPYSVGGWAAMRTGQKKGSFTLHLLHCDARKYIKPFAGNTVIESRDIVFRRKVPSHHVASWLRRVGELQEEV
jgi:hypothetical protein